MCDDGKRTLPEFVSAYANLKLIVSLGIGDFQKVSAPKEVCMGLLSVQEKVQERNAEKGLKKKEIFSFLTTYCFSLMNSLNSGNTCVGIKFQSRGQSRQLCRWETWKMASWPRETRNVARVWKKCTANVIYRFLLRNPWFSQSDEHWTVRQTSITKKRSSIVFRMVKLLWISFKN